MKIKNKLVKIVLLGEIIETQLSENYLNMKINRDKESFRRIIADTFVKKCGDSIPRIYQHTKHSEKNSSEIRRR